MSITDRQAEKEREDGKNWLFSSFLFAEDAQNVFLISDLSLPFPELPISQQIHLGQV